MTNLPPPSYPAFFPTSPSPAGPSLQPSSSSASRSDQPPSPPADAPLPWPDEIAFVSFSPCSGGPTPAGNSPLASPDLSTRSSFPSSELIDLTGLNDSKPKLHVVLAEKMQFVRPPQGFFRADGTYHTQQEGRISRVMGFCHVSLPSKKLVKSIRVKLVCTQRLLFPVGVRSHWEESVVFSKEVVYDGTGLESSHVEAQSHEGLAEGKEGHFWLERGVSSFEFMIRVPSTSPCRDYCDNGSVSWNIYASVHLAKEKASSRGGLLGKLTSAPAVNLLEDQQLLYLYALPPEDETLQFSTVDQFPSPYFGLYDFSMGSSALTVAGPLSISFTLQCVPPDLTIFAIRAWVQQTVHISASHDRKTIIAGPQQTVARDGPKSGWEQAGFAEKAGKAKKGEGIVLDTRAKAGDADMVGKTWKWEKIGRLPVSTKLRPTTEQGTQTNLRFTVQLAVEVAFNTVQDKSIKVATIFRNNVRVGSCFSTIPHLTLPDYLDIPKDDCRKISWRQPPSLGCRCFDPWDEIEAKERTFLQSQGPGVHFGCEHRDPSEIVTAEEAERGRKVGELTAADWNLRRGSNDPNPRRKVACG